MHAIRTKPYADASLDVTFHLKEMFAIALDQWEMHTEDIFDISDVPEGSGNYSVLIG